MSNRSHENQSQPQTLYQRDGYQKDGSSPANWQVRKVDPVPASSMKATQQQIKPLNSHHLSGQEGGPCPRSYNKSYNRLH
jgi:hypothetical protein